MEAFLSQNLVWIILAVGAVFVFSRLRGHGGLLGFGGGHGAAFGGGDHSGHGPGGDQPQDSAPAAIDPVTRSPVDPARALSSFYGGRVYYFESAETRTKFEAAPSSYASPQPEQQQSSGRRHGCC
ncbi:MAG TPA: hypothetical protein VF814_14475 [Casimicrobiaceae bacterium]